MHAHTRPVVWLIGLSSSMSLGAACETLNGTGGDWDGTSGPDKTELVFVAAFEASKHVKAKTISIPPFTSAAEVGKTHKYVWNKGLSPKIKARHCGGDTSRLHFSGNVTKMLVIDEDLNVYPLTSAFTALPNGLSVRKDTAQCTP